MTPTDTLLFAAKLVIERHDRGTLGSIPHDSCSIDSLRAAVQEFDKVPIPSRQARKRDLHVSRRRSG